MFCPKCGSKNADEAKYCRGCGADVGDVLAVVDVTGTSSPALAEKHLDVFSSGLRGLIIGIAFVIVAFIAYAISPRLAPATLFALLLAPYFLGTGISRLVKARGLRRIRELRSSETPAALPAGDPDYIKPSRSIYETDDLAGVPRSITEHTTTHLKIDSE